MTHETTGKARVTPVSYTHLDVYKRQIYNFRLVLLYLSAQTPLTRPLVMPLAIYYSVLAAYGTVIIFYFYLFFFNQHPLNKT